MNGKTCVPEIVRRNNVQWGYANKTLKAWFTQD